MSKLLNSDLITPQKDSKLRFVLTKKGKKIAELIQNIFFILIQEENGTLNLKDEIENQIQVEKAFRLHLSSKLKEIWKSDWDGKQGSNIQTQHKNRIKKITLKFKDTTPKYLEIYNKRFKS